MATVLVMGSAQASEGMKGFPLAITLNANFISNQTDGMFTAISSFVKRGHTVSTVRALVSGADKKLIADVTTNHGQGDSGGFLFPKKPSEMQREWGD